MAERLATTELKSRYIKAHSGLRRVLAEYTGRGKLARFGYSPQGKPALPAETGLEFNLSHSDELAVCAVARGLPVGVDCEKVESIDDLAELAARILSPAERRVLADCPASRQPKLFHTLWTRKEAVLKAAGIGLAADLRLLDVLGCDERPMKVEVPGHGSWWVASMAAPDGFVAACAARAPFRIELRESFGQKDPARSAAARSRGRAGLPATRFVEGLPLIGICRGMPAGSRPGIAACALLAGAAVLVSAPAQAQRTGENVLTSAQDAFGASVGNESIGLYNPFSARGFSPVAAGNVRLEGLYFDMQASLDGRLTRGLNMRVGISSLGYPFPAPSGIADYSLRVPGEEASLSTVASLGPFGSYRGEIDAKLPINARLGVAAGVSFAADEYYFGGDAKSWSAAVVPTWNPGGGVKVTPFWSYSKVSGQEPETLIFTGGNFLPPRIRRGRYIGPEWAENSFSRTNYGVIGEAGGDKYKMKAGVFRSISSREVAFADLAIDTSREGLAQRAVSIQPPSRSESTSGEARLSRTLRSKSMLHTVHLALRARQQRRRFGGGGFFSFGTQPLAEPLDAPRPAQTFGAQTLDRVRQVTGGIAYEGRLRRTGEISLGIQRSDYRKESRLPTGATRLSTDSPWLFNAAAAVNVSKRFALYGGYSTGLEESAVAPEAAVNKDEAPPALRTRQADVGLRWAITPALRLVAGAFDVRRPYFALDRSRNYGRLGTVRHRGLEFSVAGQAVPGVHLLLGAVLLDASVSGEAVQLGLVGKRPIGSISRVFTLGAEYRPPRYDKVSVDISVESTGSRVANLDASLFVPPRSILALGARYRFEVAGTPSVLRLQAANIFNKFGWSVVGEGFAYNQPRRFTATLISDF